MYKKAVFLFLIVFVMLYSGCGSSNMSAADNNAAGSVYSAPDRNEAADDVAEEAAAGETSLSVADNQKDFDMDLEMLIYNCDLLIDTLDFDKSVSDFKHALTAVGGFVERESYYDNTYAGGFYVDDEKKKRTYEATVRVPSGQYNNFLEGAASLGSIRQQTAYVENVSQEYSDLKATLEVYEAKEERYLNLLSTITDDQYAVEVERELTDIQIQIAQLKTRMNRIDTDVAYSFINLTLTEVKQYEKQKNEDTFGQRTLNRIQESWSMFLNVLEALLVIVIMVFPYLLIVLILLLIILLMHRRRQKRGPKAEDGTVSYSAGWKNARKSDGTDSEKNSSDQNKTGD